MHGFTPGARPARPNDAPALSASPPLLNRRGALAGLALAGACSPPGPGRARVTLPSGGAPALSLVHQPPDARAERRFGPVLFVHGATFPSALAAAYRFDGVSWMDDLSRAGFDVWALDFAGYGNSGRYPQMREPAEGRPPLGRAPEAARQIARAVGALREQAGADRVSIVAHSWGTLPAGLFATQEPDRVERLVLFGPVVTRDGPPDPDRAPRAWHGVTADDQRRRFLGYVPAGEPRVLPERHLAPWLSAYLASDPEGGAYERPCVRVPAGPAADIDDAWAGRLLYNAAEVRAPVLVVRGEWDTVTTDDDARRLYRSLKGAPIKRDVVVSRGTHVMHLEESRGQLYREARAFLEGEGLHGG